MGHMKAVVGFYKLGNLEVWAKFREGEIVDMSVPIENGGCTTVYLETPVCQTVGLF